MDRRGFLIGGAASLIAGRAAGTSAQSRPRHVTVRVRADRPGRRVEAEAIGLSFESSLLARADVFAACNASLVELVRALAPEGVIRIGANDSEFCRWTRDSAARIEPPFRWPIHPHDIDRLAGFLDACGWRLIYGINLGHGEAARAADEAAYVVRRLGDRLVALQLGNEPDLYARNGLRPGDYGVSDYVEEWRRYVAAIRARVPEAPLAAPDVAHRADWIETFARLAARELRFVSCHHYATGPAEDARVGIADMLARPPAWLDLVAAAAADAGLRWRITEGNSCYNHGKPGVSDTLASALWAVDTLLDMARRGCMGFCFHCGPGRPYTVVDLDPASGRWRARPIHHGLRLAAQIAGMRLVPSEGGDAALRVHAGIDADESVTLVAINLDPRHAKVIGVEADRPLHDGRVLSLRGPGLAARQALTFAGVPADANLPIEWAALPAARYAPVITAPPASATLVRFGR